MQKIASLFVYGANSPMAKTPRLSATLVLIKSRGRKTRLAMRDEKIASATRALARTIFGNRKDIREGLVWSDVRYKQLKRQGKANEETAADETAAYRHELF